MKSPQFFGEEKDLPAGTEKVDILEGSLKELFFIEHPHQKKGSPEADGPSKSFINERIGAGQWIYYPWLNKAVHTLAEDLYFKLRTARNRNLITEEEQVNYRNMKVGVAGLSVGSGIVSALVISGGPKTLKIADFDIIEVSNLNRIAVSITDVGSNKAHVMARKIWELDPYADLTVYDSGVSKDNLDDFLAKPKLDVFIDEMDNIGLKILGRNLCKKHKIPVLMATDNGDTVILDVERFDLEPEREIFHGLAGDINSNDMELLDKGDRPTWLRISSKVIGPELINPSLQSSILAIGQSLGGVPQLGTTASIAGAALSLTLRRIANRQEMPSGRYIIGLEEKIIPDWNEPKRKKDRQEATEVFKSKLFPK